MFTAIEYVNDADNLINAFTEIGSNLKILKKPTITLRKGKSEDDDNEQVDVILVANALNKAVDLFNIVIILKMKSSNIKKGKLIYEKK